MQTSLDILPDSALVLLNKQLLVIVSVSSFTAIQMDSFHVIILAVIVHLYSSDAVVYWYQIHEHGSLFIPFLSKTENNT